MESNLSRLLQLASPELISSCHDTRIKYTNDVEKKMDITLRAYEFFMKECDFEIYPMNAEKINFFISILRLKLVKNHLTFIYIYI